MAVRSVNFRGYRDGRARSRRARREGGNARAIIDLMRALGMKDSEIVDVLKRAGADQAQPTSPDKEEADGKG